MKGAQNVSEFLLINVLEEKHTKNDQLSDLNAISLVQQNEF